MRNYAGFYSDNRRDESVSKSIPLVAGRRYYIEAFAKAPAVNAFNIPNKPPPSDLEERSERAKESTPGSTTCAPSL